MTSPSITVLMPVYNAEKYVKDAIESILNQTFSDFVFLIINDGSTDRTEEIVLSFADYRIKYVKNNINIGLTASLNKGIMLTTTKYLARMDADDISLPDRLKFQYNFMEANEEIGVCSTWYEIFGKENTKVKLELSDAEIKAKVLFGTAICHPTVILRTEVLKKNNATFGLPFEFLDGFGHRVLELEDVALWNKLKHITKFAILKQIFLKYRWEGQNLTQQRLDVILERKKEYFKFLLDEIDIYPNDMNLLLHINFKYIINSNSLKDIDSFKKHLSEILLNNKQRKIYDQASLEKVVHKKWDNLFYYLPDYSYKMALRYIKQSNGLTKNQFLYLLKYTFKRFVLTTFKK